MAGVITPYGIKVIKTASVSAVAITSATVLFLKWKKQSILREQAQKKKSAEMAAIEMQLQKLEDENPEEREKILAMNPKDVVHACQTGELDPIKVLHAYLYKACFVTKKLNCVTGLIKDAERIASKLKNHPSRNYELCGLPVSLKESLETEDMDSTLGLAQHIGFPANDDCVLAKVLKHCGAVPFVKTNLSQLMFSFESSNSVFGTTVNPQNVKFTPGGSSSGEGALIGAGGSPLGFGTDTGGSIRCPSHMCGICGLKPSMNRISTKGLKGLPGRTGPMAKDVDTLVLAMRALLCSFMFELDVDVPPIPFNEAVFNSKSKLRIGYYLDDGYNEPVPAIKRAVSVAKNALERAGHTMIRFDVPRPSDGMRIFTALLFGDGDRSAVDLMKYEQVDPMLKGLFKCWTFPFIPRWIVSTILSYKWPRLAEDFYIHGGGNRSVTRLRKIEAEGQQYKEDFHEAWRYHKLDAVICPPFPVVAGPLGSVSNATAVMSYTGMYNFLNYPAGVLPVTKVNQADMDALKDYKGHYGDPWDKHIKTTCEGSLGISVGVQCVALPFNDEMCLRVMKEIETLIK